MKRIIASVIVLFIALAAGGSALDRAPKPAPELPQQTAPAEESIEVTATTESVEAEEPAPEEAPVGIVETQPQESPDAAPKPEAQSAEPKSIFDLMTGGSISYEADLAAYYLNEMTAAAAEGDVEAGRSAEEKRNAVIDASAAEPDPGKISFDDLYLLSKVICYEAGSDWLTDEFRICVGEVIMNRVASPEYPVSILDVMYQKGQYSCVNTARFAGLVPTEECVDAALRLLCGERRMVPSVVFQSNDLQGEPFTMYTDRRLGTTYFCLSENQELYPID